MQELEKSLVGLHDQVKQHKEKLAEIDPCQVRQLYEQYRRSQDKRLEAQRKQAWTHQIQLKSDQNVGHLQRQPNKNDPQKPLSMDEFISDGYLLKALELPEETCNLIIGQPVDLKADQEEPPHPRDVIGELQPNPTVFVADRVNGEAPITLDERIEQIAPLSECIARDVGEVANLDRIPENILMRARGCLWLALTCEIFSLYSPQEIKVPMLARLTQTNMQAFFCPCQPMAAFDNEMACIQHIRGKHPLVYRALLTVRRTVDPYEYTQFTMPFNEFVPADKLEDLKQRLCKLASIRKRLPLMREEKETILKRRKEMERYRAQKMNDI